MVMNRTCLIYTLTCLMALSGMLRLDYLGISKRDRAKAVAQDSHACPMQRCMLRTHRGSDLSRLCSTLVRFAACLGDWARGGTALLTSRVSPQLRSDNCAANLRSRCVKLQV